MTEDRQEAAVARKSGPPATRWSAVQRQTFLDHLAANCSVQSACRAMNVWHHGVYRLRRKDADFALAWKLALHTGYERLEAMLLAKAGAATTEAEDAIDGGTFDPELAIRLIAMHDARMKVQATGAARPQVRLKRATPEETDTAILKQLAALDRRMKAKDDAATGSATGTATGTGAKRKTRVRSGATS